MTINIILIIVIFFNLFLSFFVLTQNLKSISNRIYSLLSFLAAIWTFTNYMTGISASIYWLDSAYALGDLVISAGLIWVLQITERSLKLRKVALISLVTLLFFIGSFQNGFITNSYAQILLGAIFIDGPGWGLILYTIYYIIIAFLILWKLYDAHNKSSNLEEKSQFKFIFIGALITLTITAFSSFILPSLFSIFLFAGIDSIGFLFFISFIAYSITKHHLFNIRVIAVQIITFGLWIFILVRTLLAENVREMMVESGLLLVSIVVGIILIRSVFREIRQRERIEELAADLKVAYGNVQYLNENLEHKVAEQTIEIRKSYELEQKAHRDLQKLNETKDQFILITQHHLRTPVVNITGQMEAMLQGTYGAIKSELRQALKDTAASAHRLTRIADDFLGIAALKVGAQILNPSPANLKLLVEDVLKELRIDIERAHIKITYPKDDASWLLLSIDAGKVREVLLIVIENAVKYNNGDGSIAITTQIENGQFKLSIENTGIGIAPHDMEKISHNLFHRGEQARIAHPIGMGIGLSVSRTIMRAHHGDLQVGSGGVGKGARVVIGLPLK